jgi:hypothetical protein
MEGAEMENVKITFFMLVTDPDVIIADYAVRSYARIRDVKFKLQIYSNWISSALKQKYFPRWRSYSYVDLVENEGQTDDGKPSDRRLQGPFEHCDTIWDRELKKISTSYFATVDADFEVLDAQFISVMLARLDGDPKLVAMSTDYYPMMPEYYDSYSNEVICLNERWHTWFCIYKREALQCPVSHSYYEEITSGPIRRCAWDSAGYFQKALKDNYGWELTVLDQKYQACFIHYGAFSRNRHINERNVGLYRGLQILNKRGIFGGRVIGSRLGTIDERITQRLANCLTKMLFRNVDRSHFWEGWSKR